MRIEQRIEYYEKMYLFEIERREKINARLNIPMGVIVALLGFIFYLLNSKEPLATCFLAYLFYTFLIVAVISVIISCVHFKNCWSGLTDMFMPTVEDIESYHANLVRTYEGYDQQDTLIEQYFHDFLLDSYSKYATFNSKNNDYRSTQLYKAVRAITIALTFSFVAGVCFRISPLLN